MMELRNLKDIESALVGYIPAVKEVTGKGITLERMYPLMEAVGNPERKLSIIHIAGTSGKTSTAYYATALLIEAGKKVGLTVSPHVDSVAERVQINLEPIAESDFAEGLSEFIDIVTAANIHPTYFELLVAFAYWYFVKVGVDYAVIETGMGGLQDGTNVAGRADKVCVITDIGYDHVQVLGATLPEIAAQKAGIIHNGNHALMLKQPDEIMDVFQKRCDDLSAKFLVLDQENMTIRTSEFEAMPEFQQRNWLLAHEAYKYLQMRDGLTELSREKIAGTMLTRVPGRMDEVIIDGKKIIMDGAHNAQKMQAFVSSFQKRYPGQKAAVMMSLKQDKQFAEVLPLLLPMTSALIVTTFTAGQDLPSVSIDPKVLSDEARKVGFGTVIVEPDRDKAYQELLNQSDDKFIITGSFYLIGQLRQVHKELLSARS